MWGDIIYTTAQAKYKFSEITSNPKDITPSNIKSTFETLRKQLLDEKQKYLLKDKNKITPYSYDLHMALSLYRILNQEYNFNERFAAQNEIWRYLSLEVVPDLVVDRFLDDGKELNDERFYKRSSRIWLKSLWWYIHLSWQNYEEETLSVLEDNTADEIMQLIDRSGTGGYRINVTREIMKQYNKQRNIRTERLFRKVLKLNTARLKMVEPELVNGGVEYYVEGLFNYFLEKKEVVKVGGTNGDSR